MSDTNLTCEACTAMLAKPDFAYNGACVQVHSGNPGCSSGTTMNKESCEVEMRKHFEDTKWCPKAGASEEKADTNEKIADTNEKSAVPQITISFALALTAFFIIKF